MCIRDRRGAALHHQRRRCHRAGNAGHIAKLRGGAAATDGCLLYTSDAADERSSVDLGGRRIIKKKKAEVPDDSREVRDKPDDERECTKESTQTAHEEGRGREEQ